MTSDFGMRSPNRALTLGPSGSSSCSDICQGTPPTICATFGAQRSRWGRLCTVLVLHTPTHVATSISPCPVRIPKYTRASHNEVNFDILFGGNFPRNNTKSRKQMPLTTATCPFKRRHALSWTSRGVQLVGPLDRRHAPASGATGSVKIIRPPPASSSRSAGIRLETGSWGERGRRAGCLSAFR